MITDESGNEIYQKHDLNIGKPDYLIISASELQTGVFLYMLVLNDKVVKTKKFIIIK